MIFNSHRHHVYYYGIGTDATNCPYGVEITNATPEYYTCHIDIEYDDHLFFIDDMEYMAEIHQIILEEWERENKRQRNWHNDKKQKRIFQRYQYFLQDYL